MKRKVKFQEGGPVEASPPPAPRRSAITNEPVGARARRFFSRAFRRTPEEQDLVDAYRLQIPVDEIRRRRLAATETPAPAAPSTPASTASPPASPESSSQPAAERMLARLRAEQRPRPAARPRPATAAAAPPPRPRIREMSADELNEMELRRARAERQMEEDDARERRRREEEAARQMGGSGNIGSASARERGELEGHPGDFTYNNYKKGGMVKPKAAPKKMMKGGIVAKPKVAAKSKPKSKPMPFKKGGVIKKGRK